MRPLFQYKSQMSILLHIASEPFGFFLILARTFAPSLLEAFDLFKRVC